MLLKKYKWESDECEVKQKKSFAEITETQKHRKTRAGIISLSKTDKMSEVI